MSLVVDVESIARSLAFNRILSEKGEDIHAFCLRTGEDYSSIYKYLNRSLKIGTKVARKLERLLEVAEGELDSEISKELVVYIPVISNMTVENWSPFDFVKNANEKELMSKTIIKAFGWKIENLAIVISKDDSMAPTIPDGAKVIVDLSLRLIHDNKVYAIKINNEIYIRRIVKSLMGNNLTLIPDAVTYNGSKNYKEIELKDQPYEIIGRVIMLKDALI